jgi:hypothetical protein
VWRADRIDEPIRPSDTVLLLVRQAGLSSGAYVDALEELDRHGRPLGIIPIGDDFAASSVSRLLQHDAIVVDFTTARFRMSCAEANLPTAPTVLQCARFDDPASVANDLGAPDLLLLQGHAGAVDGNFGPSFILCSRHDGELSEPPLYPCFKTGACFRQELYGRLPSSTEGLIDAATLRSALVVLDGCGTLAVPGSLFRYETSLVRSLLAGQARAAVMTHGLAATPFAAVVAFLGMLARGRPLGAAVRAANLQSRLAHGPGTRSSLPSWILVGNPDVHVEGIPLLEATAVVNGHTLEVSLDSNEIPPDTGAIAAIGSVTPADGPLDISCADGRWGSGAIDPDGCVSLWVGPSVRTSHHAQPEELVLSFTKRPRDVTRRWRDRARWLRVNTPWVTQLTNEVESRGGDGAPLRALASSSRAVCQAVDYAAFASVPLRPGTIAPSLASLAHSLDAELADLDRRTVSAVAEAVPVTGARLFRFWHPPWLHEAQINTQGTCSCGCRVIGIVCCHPIFDVSRVLLSCPACGPIGDVTGRVTNTRDIVPTVSMATSTRYLRRGATVKWPVGLAPGCSPGFACVAMIEPPFRHRWAISEVFAVQADSTCDVALEVAADWPLGLSRVVIVVAAGAELSFLDFDAEVRA